MTRVRGQPPRFPMVQGQRLPDKQPLLTTAVNGGMNSSYDPADIPNNAFTLAKNVRVRYDYTRRRGGYQKFGAPLDPDVLDVAVRGITAIRVGSQITLCYFTEDASYYWDRVNGWLSIGGTWYTPSTENYSFTTFIDPATEQLYVIMANGSDVPRYFQYGVWPGSAWGLLGNAPRARYVSGFQDRVILASIGDTPEGRATVAWCGDRNFQEYDPLTDETAGSGKLRISSIDAQDNITGLFSFENVLVIPREHSLWLATPTRIATSPVTFYEGVPRIGCDMPTSAIVTEAGLVFASRHNEDIFLYTPGQAPQRIGEPIKRELFAAYSHGTDIVFSAYDYQESKYILGINSPTTDVTKLWMFFLPTRAWEYDEIDSVVAASGSVQIYDSGGLAIEELVPPDWADPNGYISELTGTIAGLRDPGEPVPIPRLYFGTSDGYILEEHYPEREGSGCPDVDFVGADDAVLYTSSLVSKEFRIPRDKFMWNEIRLLYTAISAGQFVLSISKNGGDTWTAVKTYTFTASNVKKQFQYSRLWRARRLMWKIEWTSGALSLHEYELLVYTGGQPMPE